MYIDSNFIAYESEREAVKGHRPQLIMDTTDTQPCFTKLRLYTDYNRLNTVYKNLLEQHRKKYLMSHEHYKAFLLQDRVEENC